MSRSRASARKAGTAAERAVADWLARELDDDRIDRQPRAGARDRGDVGGVRVHGQRCVIEVKNAHAVTLAAWIAEAEVERQNDKALAGLVVAKRHGKSDPSAWYVVMSGADLLALLTGTRPA